MTHANLPPEKGADITLVPSLYYVFTGFELKDLGINNLVDVECYDKRLLQHK